MRKVIIAAVVLLSLARENWEKLRELAQVARRLAIWLWPIVQDIVVNLMLRLACYLGVFCI
jgi:hypothetical protein